MKFANNINCKRDAFATFLLTFCAGEDKYVNWNFSNKQQMLMVKAHFTTKCTWATAKMKITAKLESQNICTGFYI